MSLSLYLQLAALALVALGSASLIGWTWYLGISPIPSNHQAQTTILAWLKQHPPPPGLIIEPGAGWGTLAFPLAQQCPHHQVLAYERSWLPWLWMTFRKIVQPRPNLQIRRQDLHTAPWHEASLVACYLFTGAMTQLQQPLAQSLPPHAWVLSNTFALPQWTPHTTIQLHDLYKTRIYVYKIPQSTPPHGGNHAPPTHTNTN